MRKHLTSIHLIDEKLIEEKNVYNDVEEYETFVPSEKIKKDVDAIDINHYNEDVEQPIEDENEISNIPQDIVKEGNQIEITNSTPQIIKRKTRPNDSKYDEYFDINHVTNQATCRICGKTIRKNCSGMRLHLSSRHQIDIDADKITCKEVEEYGAEPQENLGLLEDPSEKINYIDKTHDSKYDKHFVINHVSIKAVCRICGKTIRKNCSGMRKHLSSKHQINFIEDKVVRKIPKWKTTKYSFKYDDHYDINPTTKEAVCKTCKKSVSENMIWHLNEHKPRGGIAEVQCTQCGKHYAGEKGLKLHVESVHEAVKTLCSECGMTFSCSTTLRQHRRVVHGRIKKYKCEICSREFGQRIDVRRHIEAGK